MAGKSIQISEIFRIEIHNARNLLRKYHKQGLLSRVGRDELGAYLYEITDKGVDRIDWLEKIHPGYIKELESVRNFLREKRKVLSNERIKEKKSQ